MENQIDGEWKISTAYFYDEDANGNVIVDTTIYNIGTAIFDKNSKKVDFNTFGDIDSFIYEVTKNRAYLVLTTESNNSSDSLEIIDYGKNSYLHLQIKQFGINGPASYSLYRYYLTKN